MTPLRIALLAHSTNPRGGVAHAMALGDALHDRGHDVTLFAPDVSGNGFPRPLRCKARPILAKAVSGSLFDLVECRVAEYVAHFEQSDSEFDIYHAQDGISGNALATMVERGVIEGFIRTVHHLDDFADPRLNALQDRSVRSSDALICVSDGWARDVRRQFDRPVTMIANGVDLDRFTPTPSDDDAKLRTRFRLGDGLVFLSVGGVEARKNSINILKAFVRFHASNPAAQLVIAGGATLLDHGAYRRQFEAVFSALSAETRAAVLQVGVVTDAEMPALMRQCDVLLFPSVKEGFGLVVLEAMACGTPTVVSRITPFTEYLAEPDCAWCDPLDADSIANAMQLALTDRATFTYRGFAVAHRFPWSAAANAHEMLYFSLLQEHCHAANAI